MHSSNKSHCRAPSIIDVNDGNGLLASVSKPRTFVVHDDELQDSETKDVDFTRPFSINRRDLGHVQCRGNQDVSSSEEKGRSSGA